MEFTAERIVLFIISLLVAMAAWLIRRWADSWETRLVAQAKELESHRDKLSDHESKHQRQDERNRSVERTLERIEKGIDQLNTNLTNVSNRRN